MMPFLFKPGAIAAGANSQVPSRRCIDLGVTDSRFWVAFKEFNFLGNPKFPLKGSLKGDIDIDIGIDIDIDIEKLSYHGNHTVSEVW